VEVQGADEAPVHATDDDKGKGQKVEGFHVRSPRGDLFNREPDQRFLCSIADSGRLVGCPLSRYFRRNHEAARPFSDELAAWETGLRLWQWVFRRVDPVQRSRTASSSTIPRTW